MSRAVDIGGFLPISFKRGKQTGCAILEALAEELRGTGVTVTALCPGPTATGFGSRLAPRFIARKVAMEMNR